METSVRDAEIKKLYLEGASRQEVKKQFGIAKNNTMSSISNRLHLHWSWPLENRRSGIQPLSAQTRGPRKPNQTGGGTITSIRARASRVTGPAANLEVAPDAPLYETPSPARRHYGPSTRLSSREKYQRGLVDKESSIDRSAAFDGIDPEVVAAFAPFYK